MRPIVVGVFVILAALACEVTWHCVDTQTSDTTSTMTCKLGKADQADAESELANGGLYRTSEWVAGAPPTHRTSANPWLLHENATTMSDGVTPWLDSTWVQFFDDSTYRTRDRTSNYVWGADVPVDTVEEVYQGACGEPHRQLSERRRHATDWVAHQEYEWLGQDEPRTFMDSLSLLFGSGPGWADNLNLACNPSP